MPDDNDNNGEDEDNGEDSDDDDEFDRNDATGDCENEWESGLSELCGCDGTDGTNNGEDEDDDGKSDDKCGELN